MQGGNADLLAVCFMLVSCLVYSSTLKMEATFLSESLTPSELHDVVSK
jgi:hypothetical protein